MKRNSFTPIAIVGMSAIFPGSRDGQGFWRDIVAGKDLITDIDPDHWLIEDYYDPNPNGADKTYCKRGAFLNEIPFNFAEFSLPPKNLLATDTSQLLALIGTQQILKDIFNQKISEIDLSETSIILGATGAQELMLSAASKLEYPIWLKALREQGINEEDAQAICKKISNSYPTWQENTFPGLLGNVVAGRIANYFNFGGSNFVVDAACASTLAAVKSAIDELQLGSCNLAVTGGVDTMQHIAMFMCFSKTPALSPSGICAPFSDHADGTLLGEGVGLIALKRLEDAERDSNAIYAVIRGVGFSSDGKGKSVYAPAAAGQAKALARCYHNANYSPTTVELVEAHGTGTKAGDAAEFTGLCEIFSENKNNLTPWCALGSVKSQIGHSKAAAGAAGLFKAVMSLTHKVLPPTLNINQPSKKLAINASPFYLNTKTRPWIRDRQHPRRAGVSSFGFGGSNFHITLEAYENSSSKSLRYRNFPAELIILTAETSNELQQHCQQINNQIQKGSLSLVTLAKQSQHTYSAAHPIRLAIIAKDNEDLSQKLARIIDILNQKIDSYSEQDIYLSQSSTPGKIAFLFPGQGSQYIDMTADLVMGFDQVLSAWDETATFEKDVENKVHQIVFPQPVFNEQERISQKNNLQQTQWAQPAITTASIGLFKLIKSLNIRPDYMAGHSLGELTALCAGGAFSREALFNMAKTRGQLMAKAATDCPGGMLAVFAEATKITELIERCHLNVTIANYNSPQQLVVSGLENNLDKLISILNTESIHYTRLPVSVACHSTTMQTAAEAFAKWLKNCACKQLNIPVYSNVTGALYSAKNIKPLLSKQITQPVLFTQIVENMYQQGVRTFIEIGPNQVLHKLVDQCLVNKSHVCVSMDNKNESSISTLWKMLAKLFCAGVAIDFSALWQNYRIIEENTTKNNQHNVMIKGCNYGKLYPPRNGAAGLPSPNFKKEKSVSKDANSKNPPNQALIISFQNQISQAHAMYQKTMSQSHLAFLQTAEATLKALSGAEITSTIAPISVTPTPNFEIEPVTAPSFTAATQSVAPAPQSVTQPVAQTAPQPTAAPAAQAVAQPEAPPIASPPKVAEKPPERVTQLHAVASAPATDDLTQLVLDVVAENTGYPVEMIGMDMNIESELGIDSIKRVEILSAVQSRVPNLPKVDPEQIASLKTLNQIVEHFQQADKEVIKKNG